MKVAILSDIHANFEAFQAVLADCAEQKVLEIFSLGDTIGYGPDPDRVTARVREMAITSIMGNHEYAMVNKRYRHRINPQARQSLEMNVAKLSPEDKEYLSGLPTVLSRYEARFVHGCPPKSIVAYLFNPRYRMVLHLFRAITEKICFYGHTHAIDMFDYDGERCHRRKVRMGTYLLDLKKRYMINPGSVGQPRDSINKQAKYLIWDRALGTITFRGVSYPVEKTVQKIKAMGLPSPNWQRLL